MLYSQYLLFLFKAHKLVNNPEYEVTFFIDDEVKNKFMLDNVNDLLALNLSDIEKISSQVSIVISKKDIS